jgi:hypothetical protein
MRSGWGTVFAGAMLLLPGMFPAPSVLRPGDAQGPHMQPAKNGAPVELAMLAPPLLSPPTDALGPHLQPSKNGAPIQLAMLAPPPAMFDVSPPADPPVIVPDLDDDYEAMDLREVPDEPPTKDELCAMLEAEANVRALPAVFFVRLIWQESRFNPRAVSPVGAQGIAQFMPATAAERGLEDPFDPVQALGKSAQLLSDLKEEFGNLGLAAAAYNAGPGRVQRWLDGATKLPRETRHYVAIITGRTAEDWKDGPTELPQTLFDEVTSVQDWCRALPVRGAKMPVIEEAIDEPDAEKRWGVQLAAGTTKAKATRLLVRARQLHGDVLEGAAPSIVRKRVKGRGRKPLYAVRVALATRDAANSLCTRLRKDGGACTVLKN